MASRGGSYETTPCPSEMVPGRLGGPAADDGDDGRLDGIEAPGLTVYALDDVVAHDISITAGSRLAVGGSRFG